MVMRRNKEAILLIDGLPSSSKANLLVEQIGDEREVFYVSFPDNLHVLTMKSINSLLDENVQAILKTYKQFSIIGISFGGYIVAHDGDLLSRYSEYINRITLYSPVARLSEVIGIETLPAFLNEKYPNLRVEMKDFLNLDKALSPNKLLSGELAGRTRIILGAKDEQLLVDFHRDYFRRFKTDIVEDGHISISTLMRRGIVEWM